jgi:hypothetical protein
MRIRARSPSGEIGPITNGFQKARHLALSTSGDLSRGRDTLQSGDGVGSSDVKSNERSLKTHEAWEGFLPEG